MQEFDSKLISFEHFHIVAKNNLGVELDKVQADIHDVIPVFDLRTALIIFGAALVFWTVLFFIIHLLCHLVLTYLSVVWKELPHKDKAYYVQMVYGIVMALMATSFAFYCMAYADGKSGTNWLQNKSY